MNTGSSDHPSKPDGDSHDWERFRAWCVWYLEEFLRSVRQENEGPDYRSHEAWLETLPFDRRRWSQYELSVTARDLLDELTGVVSEAIALRVALPGEFDELVAFLSRRLVILKENSAEANLWAAFEREELS